MLTDGSSIPSLVFFSVNQDSGGGGLFSSWLSARTTMQSLLTKPRTTHHALRPNLLESSANHSIVNSPPTEASGPLLKVPPALNPKAGVVLGTVFTPFVLDGKPEPASKYSHIRPYTDQSAWKCQLKQPKEIQDFMSSGEVEKKRIDEYVRLVNSS